MTPDSLAHSIARAALLAGGAGVPALALTQPAEGPTPAVPVPSVPAAPAAAPQRVEITGSRGGEDEQRRRSTAAKIVVGRDEIEAYGDSSIGEVLRRLPGVTTPGGPGRGGAPRLRGLGGGYTRLLIDGEPIPRGFSLEQLTPEQVERIEILRAPTAETGARAIAGTINIVLREGQRRRLNDLRPSLGVERGEHSPGLFWTHNDSVDALTYNLSGSAFERRTRDTAVTETRTEDATTGDLTELSREARESRNRRRGLNLTARLQWRLDEPGDQLTLTPSVFHADNEGRSRSDWQAIEGATPYDLALGDSRSRFTVARMNGQWRQRLESGARAELSGTASRWRSHSDGARDESAAGVPLRRIADTGDSAETSLGVRGKWSLLLGGDGGAPAPQAEHSLVLGGELEWQRRDDARRLTENGLPLLTDFGDTLSARSTRAAIYAQDEWNPSPRWSLHAGLRWEGISTEGDAGSAGEGVRPRNRNGVWTPLAHAVWKPDPKSRSQLRASLTRSWRAPSLNNLIARPSPSTRFPLAGPNEPTAPDRAGNPDLQPELATGIDLAWEHYPAGGGVLSANLFHRRIRDLMRTVTTLETVPWSPVPRWVARTQNVGAATTQGLELEAKGRLAQFLAGEPARLPRVELRANLSLYRSRVDEVPGPDNRLEQQAGVTANLGADWSPRGWPVKLGGNVNWVPGYETQVDATRRLRTGTRRIADAYALWTLNPAVALRLQAGNLAPRDSRDAERVEADGVVQATRTASPSAVNWQLRLELKL